MSDAKDNSVTLQLTREEALVLFEWLATTAESKALPFADKAEELVLWHIEAQLERVLVEPFQSDYADLLAMARATVRGPGS